MPFTKIAKLVIYNFYSTSTLASNLTLELS